MAKVNLELPLELMEDFKQLNINSEKMMGEMTRAGAIKVYNNIKNNMKRSFKSTNRLEKCLKVGKPQKSSFDDDTIFCSVSFIGYLDEEKKHPASVAARSREYGNSRGETRKPFFRKSFKENEITEEMLKIQDKYLPKE